MQKRIPADWPKRLNKNRLKPSRPVSKKSVSIPLTRKETNSSNWAKCKYILSIRLPKENMAKMQMLGLEMKTTTKFRQSCIYEPRT